MWSGGNDLQIAFGTNASAPPPPAAVMAAAVSAAGCTVEALTGLLATTAPSSPLLVINLPPMVRRQTGLPLYNSFF